MGKSSSDPAPQPAPRPAPAPAPQPVLTPSEPSAAPATQTIQPAPAAAIQPTAPYQGKVGSADSDAYDGGLQQGVGYVGPRKKKTKGKQKTGKGLLAQAGGNPTGSGYSGPDPTK
jgi:hypothetical protein